MAAFITLLTTLGCATKTDVVSYDLTERKGLYVLGYTSNADVRRLMENTLVNDLDSQDMIGYPSHVDLPDVFTTDRQQLIDAANSKNAIAVLLINQVVPGEDGLIENPIRISPEHPDLKAFYDYTKLVEEIPDSTEPVFAEVNAFLIQGNDAKLIWSGTTWSFQADGQGGAIPGISRQITDELVGIRDVLRPQ